MSGAEASLVIGLISGVIAIVAAIKSTYDAVQDKENLPEAFRDVARRLPIVQETLDAAKAQIQANQPNAASEGVKAIIKACESKAEKLKEIFQKVAPQADDSRADRYLKAARHIGKGGRVEVLMKGILEDVQLLAGNGVMNLASEAQIRDLKKAIEEISALKPSIADEEFPDSSNVFNQYGGGHMFNAIGGKNLYNLGDGNQFQGENLYFDHKKHKYVHDSSIRMQYSASKMYFGRDEIEQIREECRHEVPLTDPRDDKADIVSRFGPRVEGTCDWIAKHDEYRSWLQEEHSSLLWICGGPATGKTYLSVFLTGELEKTVKSGSPSPHGSELLAYFFCSQQDQRRNTAGALVRGLMYLLLQVKPDVIDCMLEDFSRLKKHNSLFDPSNKEALWRNFEQMLLTSGLDKIYFVLDALDECAEDSLEWLLQKLTSLVSPNMTGRKPTLKIVIASRRYPEVLHEYLYKFPQILAGQDDNSNHDLRLFIFSKVEDLADKKSVKEDISKRALVKEKWLSAAKPLMMFTNETFLWVSFVIRDLERAYLPEVEEKLHKLPRGLDGYYERMLHQISQLENHQQVAAKVIRWVAMAVRPLSLLELSIATDTLRTEFHSREEMMEYHVNLCGYFLKVDHGIVSLIHQSARDYLTGIDRDPERPRFSLFRIDQEEAHLQIAQTCVEYIQGGLKATGPFADNRTINLGRSQPNLESEEVRAFPLVQYAALNWPEHARRSSREAAIFDLSVPFFQAKSPIRQAWLHSYWLTSMPDWPPPGGSFDLIHISAFFGLKSVTEALLAEKSSLKKIFSSTVNLKSDLDMTPLHWAVRNGHESVAKLLVDHGAEVDTKGYGLTPLIWAVRNGREGIAEMLLDHQAKVDQRGYGMTGLHWAAREGRESLVRLLLDRGADRSLRTTSQNIGGTTGDVAASNAANGEFPWATVDEANSFSRQAQEEDQIVTEKKNLKSSLSWGAYPLANFSSIYLMLIHVMFSVPWVAPPRALELTLVGTTLGGVALGIVTDGTRFLWVFLGIQGVIALEFSLISWYCGAFTLPFVFSARPTGCGNSYARVFGVSVFWLFSVVMCVAAALLTLSDDRPWVGKYQWAWRPFTVVWWIGLVACVTRGSPFLVLYWCFGGLAVTFWGIATSAALSKDPPLGKTAAQLASMGGFVELVQLLEGNEKGSTALDAAGMRNDLVSCDESEGAGISSAFGVHRPCD